VARDLADSARGLLDILCNALPYPNASCHYFKRQNSEFDLLAHVGPARDVLPTYNDLTAPGSLYMRCIEEKRPLSGTFSLRDADGVKQYHQVFFPLSGSLDMCGVIMLSSRERVMPPLSEDFLMDIGSMIGMGFERVKLLEAAYRNEAEIVRLSKFPKENPNPILVCNRKGELTYRNSAAAEFLELNGLAHASNVSQLFDDGGKSSTLICRSVGEDVALRNREFRIGENILLGSVSSYQGASEATIFLQDITELKKLAHEMALANRNLTETQEKLEYKTRRALEANRHKSDFLANMSHELRTPLNAINGFSEILLDEPFGKLNEKQREYVRDILESGTHLLSLIHDILDLSKVEAGKLELDLSEFEIHDIVNTSLNMIKEKAAKHAINISVEIDENIGAMVADQRKIKQIMFNLLSNSMKFTPDGGAIGIRVDKIGDQAQFCVWDTGIGISIEDQKKIFEEFHQVDSSTTRKFDGAGLGLAIVKKFVSLHSGKVWVESKLGKGARFYFRVPIVSPNWMRGQS